MCEPKTWAEQIVTALNSKQIFSFISASAKNGACVLRQPQDSADAAFDSSPPIPRGLSWVNPRQRSPGAFKNQFGRIYVSHDCPERNIDRARAAGRATARRTSFDDYLSLCDFRFSSSCTMHVAGVCLCLCLDNGWKCVSPGLWASSLTQQTSTASAISISSSKQLPIVYSFLQLVVDFLSCLADAGSRTFSPARLLASVNSSTATLSWSKPGAPKPTLTKRNFPWHLWQVALYLTDI